MHAPSCLEKLEGSGIALGELYLSKSLSLWSAIRIEYTDLSRFGQERT